MGSKVGGPPLRGVKASEVRNAGLTGGGALEYLPFLDKDGYIVKGWSHLVAGYPKSGKTELTTRLCHEWRDERILYFTEEPQTIWEARLAELPEGWDHVTLVFALGAERSAVLEMIKRSTATVVVIDTVRSLLGLRDETDNSEVARVLNPFIAACRHLEMTLLLLHHIRKGGGQHGEGITGGHAFLGVVDLAPSFCGRMVEARTRGRCEAGDVWFPFRRYCTSVTKMALSGLSAHLRRSGSKR